MNTAPPLRTFLAGLTLLGLAAATSPLAAEAPGEAPADSRLAKDGWRVLKFEDVPKAEFAALDENAISVTADSGFALLLRPTAGPEEKAQKLSWTWKVDAPVPATDLSTDKKDDRSLAVHVWFEKVPGTTYFFASLKRSLAESFLGLPADGKILTYVWGGNSPKGTIIDNPHFKGESKMIVLRPAKGSPIKKWVMENVNLTEDYKRAFGHAPRGVKFIAISADSDDTRVNSMGAVRDMRFLP